MAKTASKTDESTAAPATSETKQQEQEQENPKPVHVEGPGGPKHLRDFNAVHIGSGRKFHVTGCCDESEVQQILRMRGKLNSKDGRFNVIETPDSREASLKRLAKREEEKKTKPATGGL